MSTLSLAGFACLTGSILLLGACFDAGRPTTPESASPSGLANFRMSTGVPTVSPVPEGASLPILTGRAALGAAPVRAGGGPEMSMKNLIPDPSFASINASAVLAVGTPSLVWYANDGSATLWKMNGPSWSGGGATVLQIPAPWRLATAADLNADGHPDLIWEATTDGTRAVTYMNGGAYAGSYTMMFVIPPEWKIVAAVDFDADNKPDLVLNNTVTGDAGVLYLNGTTWTGVFAPLPQFPSTFPLAGIGDMNGDSKPDLIAQLASTGQPTVYFMDGTTFVSGSSIAVTPGAPWKIGAVGDFDANEKNDLVLQNTSDGSRTIWLMNGLSRIGQAFLETVPTVQTIVAAAPVQWPVDNVYLVDTGQPASSNVSWALWSLGRIICAPQPDCQGYFAHLGGKFTLAAQTTLDLVEAWMSSATRGAMYVNIRADNAGVPGTVTFSKGYFNGDFPLAMWVPFSQYNVVLPAGTYWITFEPVAYTGMNGGMPNNAPSPLAGYAAHNHQVPGWYAAGALGIAIRISGRLTP